MELDLNSNWSQFINEPLNFIKNILIKHETDHELYKNPLKFHLTLSTVLKEIISNQNNLNKIPLINNLSDLNHLPKFSLIRFKCMVQDIYDPEIAIAAYKKTDGKYCFSLYSDVADDYQGCVSCNDITVDRNKYCCISVPGENSWLRGEEEEFTLSSCTGNVDLINKRANEDGDKTTDEESANQSEKEDAKRMKNDEDDEKTASKTTKSTKKPESDEALLNSFFPLHKNSDYQKCCIVKQYNLKSNELKLNQLVEVIGIIDSQSTHEHSDEDVKENEMYQMFDTLSIDGDNLSYNLVPRIHAILTLPIEHINPLLTSDLRLVTGVSESFFSKIKCELIAIFTQALFGDELAAEYVLYSLLSKVYSRRDITAIGSLPVNLIQLPKMSSNVQKFYLKSFYHLLKKFLTNSHHLKLTIDCLNNEQFIPKKNYEQNKLDTGLLQLPMNTLIFIDEINMNEGKLISSGINNLKALNDVIRWQKLSYEFQFNRIEYETDLNILVFSEGKSLLPVSCKITLKETEEKSIDDIKKIFETIYTYLDKPLMENIRKYLTLSRNIDYDLNEEMQTFIQNELVSLMNTNSNSKVTVDDLHMLLVLSRLVAISDGVNTLSSQIWRKVIDLENQRKIN